MRKTVTECASLLQGRPVLRERLVAESAEAHSSTATTPIAITTEAKSDLEWVRREENICAEEFWTAALAKDARSDIRLGFRLSISETL